MSKQPPPAPTASAVGPCPIVIQIVGRPSTGSLPSTIAPIFFVLSFFPRDVLDEIWDLNGSVSEGFPTYSKSRLVAIFIVITLEALFMDQFCCNFT